MSGMALGVGLIITSLTTKYRDLSFLISFAVQLLMYASPIIYSSNTISPSFKKYILLNPLTGIIENFRNSFLGIASIDFASLIYSCFAMCVLILLGLMMFNKVEEKFIDTV
jgi:lipopolysaccharide transport system permease protein